MGGCLSTKKESSSSSPSSSSSAAVVTVPVSVNSSTVTVDLKNSDTTQKILLKKKELEEDKEEGGVVKKEVFVIKHRKSHDKRAVPSEDAAAFVNVAEIEKEEIGNNVNNGVVRMSRCTKEEVDAILIQCGRLSRSNSSGKTASSARKYSGSKRSYDFDHDVESARDDGSDVKKKSSDEDDQQNERQHRQRHRQSSRQSPSGRRTTPSRERDQQQSQQRSGSRERGNTINRGRKVSRSPGRRSENNAVNATSNTVTGNTKGPGKMVSVPATVTSLVMDKSNNNGAAEPVTAATTTAFKRISVKRNVGEPVGVAGSRTAASPRSQSPARTNGKTSNENQQQPSLSRNSSRKPEHSPYRRNPLSEIDPNSLAYPQSACNKEASNGNNNRVHNKSRETEEAVMVKESSANVLYQAPIQKPIAEIVPQETNYKTSSKGTLNNKVTAANIIEREHQQILEESKTQLTRSRSFRRSRDLDLNPETLLNPTPSYTALLLEDIQNFHQKSTPSISLPACVTKACSILEAVADLNSNTSSNLSGAFSKDNKNAYNFSAGIGKRMTEAKDPFVESEVFASDDLTEPSFHKYITVRRGGSELGGADLDEQESSGSNSFVGSSSQQNWNLSSSSWEPNSADSTDRWTSRSNTKEENQSSLGFQRRAFSEVDGDAATKRNSNGFSGKRRETDYQKGGNLRGRVAVAAAAAASST